MRKIVILMLALVLLLLPLATSCKKQQDPPAPTPPKEKTAESDDIGEYDFNNSDYTIFCREETDYEYESKDKGAGSDIVDNAIYKRNEEVMDRFNVNIKLVKQAGRWDEAGTIRGAFIEKVRQEYMSGGVGKYDLVSTHSVYLGTMAVEGLGQDMAALPEINFQKAWWNQNLYDELNLDGKVYEMVGDIGMTLYEYIQVLFVNENLFATAYPQEVNGVSSLENLYQTVMDGEWTWDKLWTYAENYHNGDGYGFITNVHSWRASFYSQDATLFQRDENNHLYAPAQMSDKLLRVIDDMIKYYQKPNIELRFKNGDADMWGSNASVLNPMFKSGQALFYSQIINEATNFQDEQNLKFGVLPLPKYDTLQDQYKTVCSDTVTAVLVPATACQVGDKFNRERVGVTTEALCMLSRKYVMPAYYETSIKLRYLEGDRSSEIMDMIRDGLTYEAAVTYIGIDKGLLRVDSFFETVRNGGSTQPNTIYANNVEKSNQLLQDLYAGLAGN